jgi:hypothetical protein
MEGSIIYQNNNIITTTTRISLSVSLRLRCIQLQDEEHMVGSILCYKYIHHTRANNYFECGGEATHTVLGWFGAILSHTYTRKE